MDVHSKDVRSYNMSQIKGKNTKPEILVRKYLFSKGFRYRLYDKKLLGKPDIILPKYRTIIFIHGCFWHGHEGCKYFVIPKTRTHWWIDKINRTISKDIQNKEKLEEAEWNVIIIWECELRGNKREETLKCLSEKLRTNK